MRKVSGRKTEAFKRGFFEEGAIFVKKIQI